MVIIMSIKPSYAKKILKWEKVFELRKSFSKRTVKKVVIYESAPISKVVGEFEIGEVLYEPLEDLWNHTKNLSCVNRKFFDQYFEWKKFWFAIKVKNPQRYKKHKMISDYWINFPPQSYMYLNIK